jgi:hypothetical protein
MTGETATVGARTVVTGRTRMRIAPMTRPAIELALIDHAVVVERPPVARFVETTPSRNVCNH